jgi:integrase
MEKAFLCQQMITDAKIRKLQAEAKPYKISDGRGLHLLVTPAGSKLWRIAYRIDGKQKVMSLGPYPEVSLADARERLLKVKRDLREDVDPASKIEGGIKFADIADEYLQRKRDIGRSPRTLETNEWLLRLAKEKIGHRQIENIKAAEVLSLLRGVEATGRRETAKRLRSLTGEVFRYAVSTARAESDPTAVLRGALLPAKTIPMAAITDPHKFGNLLSDIEDYDGWPTIKAALQFSALVFSRPGEIRGATWSEIKGNTWRIPAERMKMRRAHEVPLSRQALAVIERTKPLGDGGLVFPSIRSAKKPLSENALNSALRRMGYSKTEMTAHGFRSSASTMLNEKGFAKDVIEIQLSHLDENEVRRAYNRATHWMARVDMMQKWADYLDRLKIEAII